MKRVSYCGASFLTSDEGANALMQFVATLEIGDNPELVEMPAVQNDGRAVTVQLIVGSTSELISIPEDGGGESPDTTDAVAHLLDHAHMLAALPTENYREACAATDYGWDDIYAL